MVDAEAAKTVEEGEETGYEAEEAKKGCPVSKALAATDITLDAKLK
jgi:organic hydroperoxide reductase OsmC/OhrA